MDFPQIVNFPQVGKSYVSTSCNVDTLLADSIYQYAIDIISCLLHLEMHLCTLKKPVRYQTRVTTAINSSLNKNS